MEIIFFSVFYSEKMHSPDPADREDLLQRIHQDIEDITQVTISTVDELVRRGDLLDDLVDKSEKLYESSEGMIWTMQKTLKQSIGRRILRIATGVLRGVFFLFRKAINIGLLAGKQVYVLLIFMFPNEQDIINHLARQEEGKGEKIF